MPGTQSTQPSTVQGSKAPNVFDDVDEDVVVVLNQLGAAKKICLRTSEAIRVDGSAYLWRFGRLTEYRIGESRRISGHHFDIRTNDQEPGIFLITDKSTNGTYLNGERLPKGRGYLLNRGDEILVGHGVPEDEMRFVFLVPDEQPRDGIHADYQLGGLLGHGAFAIVRRATERTTNALYAVKIIEKSRMSANISVEREIAILKQLKHENIVGLKDFFEDSKSYYLVMEYVPNGDLMDYIIQYGPVNEITAKEIMRQILEAIAYVHKLGISHRDLKPDNIIIASDEPVVVKVSDFGLAKITNTGTFLKTFCGTLAYLAPEVLRGRNANQKSLKPQYSNLVDIWSLGCLLYVLLTSYLPFEGNTQDQLYSNVINGKYHTEPLEAKGLSESGKQFIRRLLEVDVEKRPTAEEALAMDWFKDDKDSNDEDTENTIPEATSDGQTGDIRTRIEKMGVNSKGIMSEVIEVSPSLGDSETDTPDSDPLFTSHREKQHHVSDEGHPAIRSHYSGVRDFDDFEQDGSQVPAGTWMKLVTCPDSEPFKDICITKKSYTVGRKLPMSKMDLLIDKPIISRKHCRFYRVKIENPGSKMYQAWFVNYSRNFCFVNGIPIQHNSRIMLNDGDRVRICQDVEEKLRFLAFDVCLVNAFNYESRVSDESGTVNVDPQHESELEEQLLDDGTLNKSNQPHHKRALEEDPSMVDLKSSVAKRPRHVQLGPPESLERHYPSSEKPRRQLSVFSSQKNNSYNANKQT